MRYVEMPALVVPTGHQQLYNYIVYLHAYHVV